MAQEPDDLQAKRPPPYDQEAVGRVARRVQIEDVELVEAHFERADDIPLSGPLPEDSIPDMIGISMEGWAISNDNKKLGCIFAFGTEFTEDSPYEAQAKFRLSYELRGDNRPEDTDVEQFVYWNAFFNAWPYWREFLTSILNRAQLPRFVVPVVGVPRADRNSIDEDQPEGTFPAEGGQR